MTSDTKQRITIFMNSTLAKHAKAQAVIDEVTLTALIEKALLKYLPAKIVIDRSEITKNGV